MRITRFPQAIILSLLFSINTHAAENRSLKPITKTTVEHRIALVIGNSTYTNSPLKNPVNDAKDVANKLRGLGFDVIERNNLQIKQIGGTLREFRSKLTPGSIGLVFYAGHGLQIKGENYLPAVDADINSEEDVPNQSIALRQIMDVLDESKTRLNLVFLDACRNNPYASSFRSVDRGLARVTAPSGTLISYATKPGSVSADGSGRNGLYTSKLLAQMDSNLQIELALKRIVTEVKSASQGKQEPWMEGSIEGDFCFAGCNANSNLVVNAVPAPSSINMKLDDIKNNQKIRKQWDQWQLSMKMNYDKIATMNLETDLQTTAWDRFIESYSQNNPYSSEDDALREVALRKKQEIQEQHKKAYKSSPQIGKIFQDCPNCPEMIVIPEGDFEMGSNNGESNEKPVRLVTITQAFALGKTEVTQEQWVAIMGSNPSKFVNCGNNCPVEQVSWDDAKEFIKNLSKKTGNEYYLPSEAEWEYACRANTSYKYCGSDNIDNIAWHDKNSGQGLFSEGKTHAVAQKQANAFGLHDMSGNVFEWVEDSYHGDYSHAPTDERAWGDGQPNGRISRGGSWHYFADYLRATYRLYNQRDTRNYRSGFRVARKL